MVYFLYSESQLREKNEALKATGKEFIPGKVVINGKRNLFTQKQTTSTMPRYYDAIVVASVDDEKSIKFTMPETRKI